MSVGQETFTLTREIAASPEHVFACWSDAEKKRGWFVDGDGLG